MGNCQAIDSATLVIQHPSGKVDKLYWPVAASEIMKMNPGHYVALLLTTTLYSSPSAAAAATKKNGCPLNDNKSTPLKITRIKLLRPTDTLVLGHVYRLITSQEVMKGLLAKKQAKMNKQRIPDFEAAAVRKSDAEKTNLVKHEKQRSRNNNNTDAKCAASKSRAWQPSLNSISEAGS